MRVHIRILLSLLLSTILITTIGATTATYDPKTNIYFTNGSGTPPFDSSDFIAHIGTLTFETTNSKLFDPAMMDSTIPNSISINGPISWYSDASGPVYGNEPSEARLVSVYTNPKTGIKEMKDIWGYSTTWPFTNVGGNLNTSLFVVDFYLVSFQTSDHYKPNANYTVTPSPPLGSFNVAVADNGGGIHNSQTYVDIDGQSGPVPLVPSGTPQWTYQDPDNPISSVDYQFSIIDETDFSIEDAIGNAKETVASAQIIVSNTMEGKSYSVKIKFEDSGFNSAFTLKLDGTDNTQAIPYFLHFLGQRVAGGEFIDWGGLTQGIFKEEIQVTGVSSFDAEQALFGNYSDAIIVTIVPDDTV